MVPPLQRRKPQVKVLELKHIEREYELVHARLKMLKLQPDAPTTGWFLSLSLFFFLFLMRYILQRYDWTVLILKVSYINFCFKGKFSYGRLNLQ